MIQDELVVKCPIGWVLLKASAQEIHVCSFLEDKQDFPIQTENTLLKEASSQIKDYFAGKRKSFDLPLSPKGTEFQQKVWAELLQIPYGETRAYSDIALQMGDKKKSRAVGMANNRNPIGLIIPCHRIIGKDGSLTGYASGLEHKKWLLEHEQKFN